MYPFALKSEAFPRYSQDGELLEMEQFEYLESEVNRNVPEYIRWVQNALNKVLGLRLVVDGKIGLATRSAIRGFQQKQGLRVDGIVGPKTEAALKAALGGQGLPQTTPPLPGGDVSATSGGPEVLDKFEYNKDTLRPFHQAQIAKIAQAIVASQNTSRPIRSVRIVGHTDPVGPDWYNTQLGQRRAERVRRALIKAIGAQQKGLAARISIKAKSLGERKPTGRGAEQDRRVEIFIPKPISIYPPLDCLEPESRNRALISWMQSGLNRLLNLRLEQNGVMKVDTRSALRRYQQRRGLRPTGVMDSTTLRTLQLDGCGHPPCAGITFKVDIDNYALFKATQLVVEDIHDHLKRYFGIATNFIINNRGYHMYVTQPTTNEGKEKIKEADAHWENVKAEIAKEIPDWAFRDEKIRSISKFRDWIYNWLCGTHCVEIGTDVEAFRTWGRGRVITGNPFTWWVRNKDSQHVWMRTMQEYHTASSNKARATMGPLMLLLHEAEHDTGKRVDGTDLPGSGDVTKEEDEVVKDIDYYAGAHPFLIPRYTHQGCSMLLN